MAHEIDEEIICFEKALSTREWPYTEKRFVYCPTFYLSYIGGRFFFNLSGEKPQLLIKCTQRQKDLARLKLMEFFKLILKNKESKNIEFEEIKKRLCFLEKNQLFTQNTMDDKK